MQKKNLRIINTTKEEEEESHQLTQSFETKKFS